MQKLPQPVLVRSPLNPETQDVELPRFLSARCETVLLPSRCIVIPPMARARCGTAAQPGCGQRKFWEGCYCGFRVSVCGAWNFLTMAPRRMHTCSSDDPRRQELRGDERELKATGLAAPRGCVRHLSVQAYLLNLLSSDWVLSLVTCAIVVRWSASPCARVAAASCAAARPTRSHVG